jgi:hypothetical protein
VVDPLPQYPPKADINTAAALLEYCSVVGWRERGAIAEGRNSMKPSVIVWDLETVPDLGGFAAANDLVGKSDVEVREAIGDKFPKHI